MCAPQRRVRVLCQRRVLRHLVAELDRRLVGVQPRLRDQRQPPAERRLLRVQLRPVRDPALGPLRSRQSRIALEDVRRHGFHRGHEGVLGGERERRGGADVHGAPARILLTLRQVQQATEPAGIDVAAGRGRVPDVHGAEMRAVRVRVADALDDRQRAAVVELLQARHAGVERQTIVKAQRGLGVHRQIAAGVVVGAVAVRNHRVEPIVAAAELEHDQRSPVRARGRGRRRRLLREDGAHERRRHHRSGRDERQPARHEAATVQVGRAGSLRGHRRLLSPAVSGAPAVVRGAYASW